MSAERQLPILGTATRILPCACIVGESLIWDDRKGYLLWVDMLGQRIHMLDPEANRHWTFETARMITSIGLREDGGYIVGLERSVALWEPDTGFIPLLDLEPDRPSNRLNEGVVGPDGCFWVGTMQNNVDAHGQPQDQTDCSGQLWRITPDGHAELMVSDGFWLTNTIAWTGSRIVVGDTGRNTLFSFAAEPGDTGLTDQSVFLENYANGRPDGSCVDADEHLWNCRVVGGAEVLRISSTGAPTGRVQTACTWPTSCAFGGSDLGTLYITSACFTMSQTHLRDFPWEGDLFACRIPGVTGRLQHRFGKISEAQ